MNGASLPGVDTKELGRRFNLVNLIPGMALILFVVVLIRSGAVTGAPNFAELLRSASWTLANIAATTLAVVVGSLLIEPFQISLVQLFEGYWGRSRVARMLHDIGVEFHRRRWMRLDRVADQEAETPRAIARQEAAAERLRLYPLDPDRLLPTRLGNVLRSGEDRAGQRYGLQTVTMWPLLYPSVSPSLTEALEGLRDQLDVAVRLCVVLLIAAAVSGAMLITDGWWLAVPAAAILLAWLAYRSAIRTAAAYGEAMGWAFDLHRFDMLNALHLPLPPNMAQEEEFNQQLSDFFTTGEPIGGDPTTHTYQHPGDERSLEPAGIAAGVGRIFPN